jgi:phospholipid/cholesterol/gamma-HCH transport system ATP-binding protein
MIRVEGVSKRFRDSVVLDQVSLDVPDGATTVILGPSGVGKTVLLRIMAGLLAPDEGRVFHDGRRICFGRFADNRELTGGLGYVFQGGALFDSLTVAENVALVLEETTRLSRAEIRSRTDEALRRVSMAEHAGLYPRALSGGMTRLVAIARALVADPRCIFFDEPTTGLDPAVRARICDMIRELREHGKRTQVIVTHDLEAARLLADLTYMLRAGKLVRADNVRKEDYEQAYS